MELQKKETTADVIKSWDWRARKADKDLGTLATAAGMHLSTLSDIRKRGYCLTKIYDKIEAVLEGWGV